MASFLSAPDELLAKIIVLLPSDDVATSVQLINRRLHRISNDPRFWHTRCRADYRHWHTQDQKRLNQPFHATPGHFWKAAWLRRRKLDAYIGGHFEQVLLSKTNRVRHIQEVCRAEVEAKDFLMAQMGENAFRGDDFEIGGGGGDGSDILARRYYASKILSSINRFLAIQEWMHVHNAQHDSARNSARLERAMAAFDMFVLHDAPHDIDATGRMLDQLAAEFVAAHTAPDVRLAQASGRDWELDTSDPLQHLTIRQRALALVRWLRSRGLVGMPLSDADYRNLRNCLLGHALTDPEHPSLPIVAATIFVSVARRIGLNAHCCAVPGHVHCTVLTAPSETLDSVPLPSQAEQKLELEQQENTTTATTALDRPTLPSIPSTASPLMGGPSPSVAADAGTGRCMFLDPYGSDDEVAVADLLRLVSQTGLNPHENFVSFLGPSPTAAMVLRLGLNIDCSLEEVRRLEQNGMDMPELFSTDIAALATEFLLFNNETKRLRRGDADMNIRALKYATLWAGVLLRRPLHRTYDTTRLQTLLGHITAYYDEDAWIVKRFLLPLSTRYLEDTYGRAHGVWDRGGDQQVPEGWLGHADQTELGYEWLWQHQLRQEVLGEIEGSSLQRGLANPRVAIELILNLDRRPAEVSRRYTQEIKNTVGFRVGQVVRHRRYGYVGIVCGWKMQSQRVASAGAATTTDGWPDANPPIKEAYYWCLTTKNTGGQSTLAQTSLELVTDPAAIPPRLFFLAGRCFKRFDRATCTFVSNVRELYPDD